MPYLMEQCCLTLLCACEFTHISKGVNISVYIDEEWEKRNSTF